MTLIKQIIIILFITFSTTAYGQDFVVQDIRFNGLHRITVEAAMLSIPIRIGDLVSKKDIQNTMRALFSNKNFEKIQIFRQGNNLLIKTKERPLINNIKLLGNNIVNTKLIMNILKKYDLNVREVLDSEKISFIEGIIENYYSNIGYYNAKIIALVKSLPHDFVDIKIVINEGDFTKINKIKILGNKFLNKKQIIVKDYLQWWYHLIGYPRYQKNILINNINKLVKIFLNCGYTQFNIFSIKVKKIQHDDRQFFLDINIYLHEGHRYKLKTVSITGDFIIKNKTIQKIAIVHNGEWYSLNKIRHLEASLRNILGFYGYPFPNIYIYSTINNITKKVTIFIYIKHHKQYHVHRIYFQGNYRTQDIVLRREIQQRENTLFNGIKVTQDQNHLNNIGYFESTNVMLRPLLENNDDNQLDIIYNVKERNAETVNVGFGLNPTKNINFQLNMLENNLLGTSYSIGFFGRKSNYTSNTEIIFKNPFFTKKQLSISKHLFYNINNSFRNDIYKYMHKNYGFKEEFNIPLNHNNYINMAIGQTHNYYLNLPPQITILQYLKSRGIITTNNYFPWHNKYMENNLNFKYGWSYQTIDRNIFPTYGKSNNLEGTLYVPSINNIYYQLLFDYLQYFPLKKQYKKGNNKWSILGELHIGYTNGFFGKENPFFAKFYAGGIRSLLRGFRTNTISPKAMYYNSLYHKCDHKPICLYNTEAIGGNCKLITSLALLAPVITNNYIGSMQLSVFIDAGTIWNSHWKNYLQYKNYKFPTYNNISKIRISTGITIKWISPLGPIILAYSKPIKYYDGDKTDFFQFSIGTN
ncbi:MAG: outer membrane protein assembly factor BamA [Candidatus Dasytiphilus stammeri]